jgi:RNA polymerase sigma-70 factor (ECF subfamily)
VSQAIRPRLPLEQLGTSEPRLIRAARRGSRDAAETLAARHWEGACRTAYLVVRDVAAAEDIAQEAMLAALASLPRFRTSRSFAPWLHRITVNKALDWSRARKRRREVVLGDRAEQTQSEFPDPLPEQISLALATLSDEDRAIVVMRHLWDYRAREIADMLDLSASTVRTRLQRALASMRSDLEESEAQS